MRLLGVFMVMFWGCGEATELRAPSEAVGPEAAEPEVPRALGDECENSKQCEDYEYCAISEGECGRMGSCMPRPTECERDVTVCGCDGVTYYSGACEAAMNGDNVDFVGECPSPPCTSNDDCAPVEYCAKVTGDCAGFGTCTPRPVMCSAAIVKVCGCDDATHNNACKAASWGVNVQYPGPC